MSEQGTKGMAGYVRVLALVVGGLLAGCDEPDLTLPTDAEVVDSYTYGGNLSVEMSGNVAVVTIVQPPGQLRRGGTLWAKLGPYVILFSRETEDLFRRFPGLAAVRAVTVTPTGVEVARALLPRDTLNELTWRRALNVAGLARRDGTRRPTLLEDLVLWGEDHTEYEYNSRYIRQ